MRTQIALAFAVALISPLALATDRDVKYSERIVGFEEWSAKSAQEKAVLGLFANYAEPTVNYVENGIKKNRVAKLTMYLTRIQMEINKPATNINLQQFLDLDTVAQLDPELHHQPVNASQLMPSVAGHGAVPNFKWCDKKDGKTYISLPNFEQPLDHLNGARPWCADTGRSICIESCFLFGDGWNQGVYTYNLTKKLVSSNPADQKDYGIAMQSEVRYYVSEAEYGQRISDLTGIKTPVRGIVEISIFYVNQVMQYGKIVAVFQEHPTEAGKTVVTSLNAIGIRTKTWNQHGVVREILQGKSRMFNTKTGITAGIPTFTKNIAKSMANILEK